MKPGYFFSSLTETDNNDIIRDGIVKMETEKNGIFKPTLPSEIKQVKKIYLSLASQLLVVLISLLTFVFFAYPCLKFVYQTKSQVQEQTYSVYAAFSQSFFQGYVTAFLILIGALSLLTAAIVLMQIYSVKEIHGPNIILLGLEVLAGEFLLRFYSFGGYFLFGLYVADFIQYFVLMGKREELDWWVFFGTLGMVLALLPSALVSGFLFQ